MYCWDKSANACYDLIIIVKLTLFLIEQNLTEFREVSKEKFEIRGNLRHVNIL